MWHKTNIPIVEHHTILARIKAYHEIYRNILKPHKKRKYLNGYQTKLLKF